MEFKDRIRNIFRAFTRESPPLPEFMIFIKTEQGPMLTFDSLACGYSNKNKGDGASPICNRGIPQSGTGST